MSTTVSDPVLEEDLQPIPQYSLGARLGAEAFGTFVLVLLGVGIALFASANAIAGGGFAVGLGFGVGVIAAASAVGHVSGGHFNPAVSLGAAIGGRIPWGDVIPYWFAQLVGGTAAAGVLFALIPSSLTTILGTTSRDFFSGTANGFGEHSPLFAASNGQAQFGLLEALLVEVVVTAVFVGVILGVTDKRTNIAFAPVAIGLSLAFLLVLAAPITNGSINPARSFAAAVFSPGWAWAQLWVFIVAPLLGAVIAGLIYRIASPYATADAAWPEMDLAAEEAEAMAENLQDQFADIAEVAGDEIDGAAATSREPVTVEENLDRAGIDALLAGEAVPEAPKASGDGDGDGNGDGDGATGPARS